jgi:hypothetical protein
VDWKGVAVVAVVVKLRMMLDLLLVDENPLVSGTGERSNIVAIDNNCAFILIY